MKTITNAGMMFVVGIALAAITVGEIAIDLLKSIDFKSSNG